MSLRCKRGAKRGTSLAPNFYLINKEYRMTQNQSQPRPVQDDSNTRKDPADWKTGDEPMTGAQRSYLETLSEEVGEKIDPNLTKAQASEKIDALRQRSPRVQEGETQSR
jgi:hypothetical protein